MSKETILKSVEKSLEVKSSAKFDPKKYYKTGEGLYVWDNFKERIVENATALKASKEFKLASFDLIKSASDETIESALPKKHIFSESDVCAIIAAMIAKQPKGENGDLITTGYVNLFYTHAFVVLVYWDSEYRRWHVFAWERDSHGWGAGSRVFSPAD